MVALDQLTDYGLDPPPGLDQSAGQAWPRSFGRARWRRQQPHALVGQQLSSGRGSNRSGRLAPTRGRRPAGRRPWSGRGGWLGRGGRQRSPQAGRPLGGRGRRRRPAWPLVTTKGGQPGQLPAAIGAAEAADRHREAVQDQDLRIKAHPAQESLAQLGLDRPQVGCLPGEGCAVDPRQGREPVAPVAAEVVVQALLRSGQAPNQRRAAQEATVPNAVATSLTASRSAGLTSCPPSRWAAATLLARLRTNCW